MKRKLLTLLNKIPAPAGRYLLDPGQSPPAADLDIIALTDDSREAGPGTIFVATDQGRTYLEAVLRSDCTAVLLRPEDRPPAYTGQPLLIVTENILAIQGALADALYDSPSQALVLFGVTGTNGKTTVTRMLFEIWQGLGYSAGCIGTVGVEWVDANGVRHNRKTGYTTPRVPQLNALLAEMRDAGVNRVALEVSSEALALGRLEGLTFAHAIFTNLTPDHLDYHGDMEAYYLAKRRLFEMTLASGGTMTVAVDNDAGRRLVSEMRALDASAKIEAVPAPFVERLPAPTAFNRMNASLAITAGVAAGETERALKLLARHAPVPGRFERVDPPSVPSGSSERSDVYGIVDYAHTPDALDNALREARGLGLRYLVCVFGCGGDRDRSKRAPMGEIAGRLADTVIVCDDNPRTEDPASIRAEILAGARRSSYQSTRTGGAPEEERILEIGDRREAIRRSVEMILASAERPAAVLVAGKGHEDYQIFGRQRVDFSDRRELEDAFAACAASGSPGGMP